MTPTSGLAALPGVGPARLGALAAAGLFTLEDLITRLPAGYRDMCGTVPVAALRSGMEAGIRVRCDRPLSVSYGASVVRVSGRFSDESGAVECAWFGQPYRAKSFVPGKIYALFGRCFRRDGRLILLSPAVEDPDALGLLPVYAPIGALRGKTLRNLIAAALAEAEDWPELLPEEIRVSARLMGARPAISSAHFPADEETRKAALKRIAFENLALFLYTVHEHTVRRKGIALPCETGHLDRFLSSLPYAMTGAQRRALDDILGDLRAEYAMARLIQGDVGCGKTVVAFAALEAVRRSGYQGALMAPTEVLALQHEREARALLEPLGARIGLLIGSMKAAERRAAHAAIAAGEWDIVVGTHAVISPQVRWARLALAVVDEQHRFGVRQREALAGSGPVRVHMLVMSATPIPRSLALTLQGDLSVSLIDEMPPGRLKVRTARVPRHKTADMTAFLLKIIGEGRQVFAVCPRIGDDAEGDAASVEEMLARYRDALPSVRITAVHGKQRPSERDAVLDAFRSGEVDILVATTLIEVGVHLPNATVMVIHDAPMFGLSTLHQLRGRVGRGALASYCFLLDDEEGKLEAFAREGDGFRIAQMDLERRGPGELAGVRQHGVIGLPLDGGALAMATQPAMLAAAARVAEGWRTSGDDDLRAAVVRRSGSLYGDGGYPVH